MTEEAKRTSIPQSQVHKFPTQHLWPPANVNPASLQTTGTKVSCPSSLDRHNCIEETYLHNFTNHQVSPSSSININMYRTKALNMATSYFRSSLSRSLEGTITKDGKRCLDKGRFASLTSQITHTTSNQRPTTSSTVDTSNQVGFNMIIDRVHDLVFAR